MTRHAAFRALLCASLVLTLGACASHSGVRDDAPPPPVGAVQDAGDPTTAAAETVPPYLADADAAVGAAPYDAAPQADTAQDPVAPAPQDDASGSAAPTQAELDYAAIYGEPPYDPVYDDTLPAPAQLPKSYDPWEGMNRRVHRFNNAVDRTIAKPLAKAYVKVVPRPMRLGVSNFFHNLGQPVSALNALLQGKPKQAAQSMGRFLLNSTLGIGGIFDPASDARLPNRSEDFGQTLGVWGWKTSRYVELPLFGPRTVRDSFGLVGDGQLSPIRQVEDDKTRVFLQGLQLVDVRTQLFAVDSMREGAVDDYALVRDAWLQRRNYQIFGEREQESEDDALPDYLREDSANPTVPVDVMPIIPGAPTN
ncbi:MlaA family lipoprotein [Luteimonas lutimaris]|uniref:VacJ family lipoprotein n=1 Tax=Luteimonas lutimaris TaxID=698645 RepID=A0ABP7M148_9GAMM|nr:VacJ family lipoprotein [Luteimonas sp.]